MSYTVDFSKAIKAFQYQYDFTEVGRTGAKTEIHLESFSVGVGDAFGDWPSVQTVNPWIIAGSCEIHADSNGRSGMLKIRPRENVVDCDHSTINLARLELWGLETLYDNGLSCAYRAILGRESYIPYPEDMEGLLDVDKQPHLNYVDMSDSEVYAEDYIYSEKYILGTKDPAMISLLAGQPVKIKVYRSHNE